MALIEREKSVRTANKRDENEAEIVQALRALGYFVDQLPGGNGRPDLLVTHGGWTPGPIMLLEVKMPGGRLNDKQVSYHLKVGRAIPIVTTIQEALTAVENWK